MAPAPFRLPVHERRAPTLYQKPSGHWNVRFRHGGKTKGLAMGLRTAVLGRNAAPPPADADGYVFEGGRWVPRHVHERFVADYRTPYLRDRLNP